MFIYLFFSVLIWQEKLSRTPGGKHRELGIGLSHLHFNEIISNWFIFTYILEILGYSLCPTLKILESSFWLWFQYIFCLGLDFFFHFVICTVRWFISSWLWIFSFVPALSCFPLETKPPAAGEWNFHPLGVLNRDESAEFSWLQPLSMPLPLGGKAFPLLPPAFWGRTPDSSSSEGDWGVDHVLPDPFPAAGPSWSTSAHITWVEWLLHELQMKCAGLNYPRECFGSTSSSRLCFWDVLDGSTGNTQCICRDMNMGNAITPPATVQRSPKFKASLFLVPFHSEVANLF